jgi:c-di-GMP-binding flagellar brake protein YcgR
VRPNPKREFLRHTANVPLEVEKVGGSGTLRETGVNVSRGGLAFESAACPEIGTILQLRIPTVQPAFEARARVVWCRSESEKYLVGVQFLDAEAAFRSRMVQQVCSIEKYRRDVHQQEGRALTPEEAATEWITRFAGRFPRSETVRPEEDSS